ncbi:hypothetical protein ACKUSY_01045 [Myroides odoratus]
MKKIYILITLLFSSFLFAQTPGGVQGATIEYWLTADEVTNGVIREGEAVSSWLDRSSKLRNFTNTSGQPPRFVESAMNYHAAVDFYKEDTEEGEAGAGGTAYSALESLANFQADPNRSYFVIWVARSSSEEEVAGVHSVPVFRLGQLETDQSNRMPAARALASGTTTPIAGGNKTYGIGMAFMTDTANRQATQQDENYQRGVQTASRGARGILTSAKSVVGSFRSETGEVKPYRGEIMEVIVLSKPIEERSTPFSETDLKKINTHLALKYGLSLPATQADYMLSDGTVVYNSTTRGYETYQADIFGIARDDASGLYQKQAMSVDNPALGIAMGTFQHTNATNTATLEDKTALVFGANGALNTATYAYDAGTRFANYTLQTQTDPVTGRTRPEKLTTAFNYKLKAKATGQQTFTLDARVGMGSWLLVSTSESFTPSQTRIYKVNEGVARNVIINDGDYVGFAYEALAPGGVVNGLRMWLNASMRNTMSVNASGQIISWTDHAGRGTTYRKRPENKGAPLYVPSEERTNFHPTALFREAEDYLITDRAAMSVASPADVAFYAVVNHNFATTRSYFIGFGEHRAATNARRPSFGVYRGSASAIDGFGRIGSTGLTNSPTRLFNPGATTIAGYHWQVGSGVTFEFDGGHSEYVRHTYHNVLMNGKGMLGSGSSSKSYYLQGVMPEVILYERALTENERARINSYLGLKYAITIKLGRAGNFNFNYLLSDNTSVWNGNSIANIQFHNNVASVVRDDDADLENLQAKSTDIGAIVHMGVGTKLGADPELGSIVNNKSAISWGHNGDALTQYSFAGNQEVCGEMDSRLGGRIWLVENTNFDQSILVRAADAVFPYNGPNWNVFLLVADSPDKLRLNAWDQVIPLDFVDGGHQANYKFPKDKKTYFTFGAKTLPGICESCDFTGVKTLDFTKSNWAKGATSGSYHLGDGFTADVKVSIESPSTFKSHYPRPSSLRSLREYRQRGTGDKKMVTEVVLKQQGVLKAAASTFEIFEIDRLSGRFSQVEVYGVCGAGVVMPKLSYATNHKRSYVIEGNQARGLTSSSYTALRGRMHVEFDTPVEKIYVVHTFTGRTTGKMRIGIGPMQFVCPPPVPAPNEDGLTFTKEGASEMLLCEDGTYTFRITNTNCAPYKVNFSDELPAGMYWVKESLSIDDQAIASAVINDYGKTRTLTIQDLEVPGTSTLTFRAKILFEQDAQVGTYENRARISYPAKESPHVIHDVWSCDRMSIGCEPTRTVVTGDPSIRPLPIETTMIAEPGCYTENKEMTMTFKINNPNAVALEEVLLEFNYNEEFTYVRNSLRSSTISLSGGVSIDTDDLGSISIENLILPAGEHTLTFKLKAPAEQDIVWEDIDPQDPSRGRIESPLYLDYDLLSESDDVCASGTTIESGGSIEVAYCTVCYYEGVEGDNGDILTSDGYLALTTLDRPNDAWVTARGNAFVVLESKTQGFVLTRLTTAQIARLNPVEGMLVYDTTVNCLKMYDGTQWGCLEQSCVED